MKSQLTVCAPKAPTSYSNAANANKPKVVEVKQMMIKERSFNNLQTERGRFKSFIVCTLLIFLSVFPHKLSSKNVNGKRNHKQSQTYNEDCLIFY